MARTGRPPGTTGIKQRLSEAALEQRRQAAKKSRPGRRKRSSTEERGRVRSVRVGRALVPELMDLVRSRTTIELRLAKMIHAELRTMRPDLERIEQLQRIAMRGGELGTMAGQVWDRHGTPRIQKFAFDPATAPRLFLDDPESDKAWEEREEEHAAGAGRRPGHANGSTRG